jgi:hypothetical protein
MKSWGAAVRVGNPVVWLPICWKDAHIRSVLRMWLPVGLPSIGTLFSAEKSLQPGVAAPVKVVRGTNPRGYPGAPTNAPLELTSRSISTHEWASIVVAQTSSMRAARPVFGEIEDLMVFGFRVEFFGGSPASMLTSYRSGDSVGYRIRASSG